MHKYVFHIESVIEVSADSPKEALDIINSEDAGQTARRFSQSRTLDRDVMLVSIDYRLLTEEEAAQYD